MRKQTKLVAVLSAAALLAIGASMTSFAKGWTVQDDEWVYLDSDDERVYGEWKKSVNEYYWLDDETGVMATNMLVEDEDDTYYVGNDGKRVKGDWVAIENEDGETINDVEVDTLWYYMGTNGKAYKAKAGDGLVKKTIDGHTYFFDENGYMQHGRIDYEKEGKTYYCGTEDQGYAYKGWQYLEIEAMDVEGPDYEDEEWFYFDGGKMVVENTKYIDGHYYSFDDAGVMETGWQDVTIASGATGIGTSAEAYISGNGAMGSGWVKADKNDESKWFYMVTVRDEANKAYRAVPFNSGSDFYRAKSIDGKTYMFDTEGRMLTGLKDLRKEDVAGEDDKYDGVTYKAMTSGIYFFEKDGAYEGRMMTGKITNTVDGEEFNYYFGKDGKALTQTLKDNVIYGKDGVRVEAQDGNSYEIVTLKYDVYKAGVEQTPENIVIPENAKVVVSSTGKVRTSGSVRIDGEKYEITYNENGVFDVVPAE